MQLRPGQDTVLSWDSGNTNCRVVAAAGGFVLLRPEHPDWLLEVVPGACTLSFLDGMIPMGWDGDAVWGVEPGEVRFRVCEDNGAPDRRSSVRLPIYAEVTVTSAGAQMQGQILDVSAGGLRFRGTGRHELGKMLRVLAHLPGGPVVYADGCVRLSEPGGVTAIEFTAFHDGSAEAVGAWTVAQLRRSLTHA